MAHRREKTETVEKIRELEKEASRGEKKTTIRSL